jgi:site-specific DNA recombinase
MRSGAMPSLSTHCCSPDYLNLINGRVGIRREPSRLKEGARPSSPVPKEEAPTRVALYTRVSTEDQAREGFSLDAQLERLRHFAKAQGWSVAGEYVDEGHSGRTTKRPMYQRMMEERARWDTLLVLKMDRIHRNSRNFMQMMDELRREGKQFASVTESLDTGTAMGRFVMDIIQRIAQLESDQIGERTRLGMAQKARQRAGNLGKPAPFGYRYSAPGGPLEPVEAESRIVATIFASYAKGAKRSDIAQSLVEGGSRTRSGKPWDRWAIADILLNPTYAGATRWGDEIQPNTHQAIIPPRDFDAVQELIRKDSPRAKVTFLTRLTVALQEKAPPAPRGELKTSKVA